MRSTGDSPALTGTIFEEYAVLSVSELGRLCTVDTHHIVALVEEGILSASVGEDGELRLSGASLSRARIALRLQRDLELNVAGVALALELMQEIEHLRRELQHGR